MSQIITIDNGILKVEINSFGAEMISVKKYGEDKLWCGDPNVWAGFSPILFPYCGGLKNNTTIYNGVKMENLPKHGFAKNCEFEVVSHEKTSACFLISQNEYTKSIYPYDFNFRVLFKLNGAKIEVYYIVENTDNVDIYCNVGCHEAYALDSSIENYSLEFSDDFDEIKSTCEKNSSLGDETFTIKLNGNRLPLIYNYFQPVSDFNPETLANDSLIFEDIKSKRVNLLKGDEVVASVYFNDFAHLVVWTKFGARYLAIEPWSGLPDRYDDNNVFENKKTIDIVKKGESKTFYHSIEF